MASGRPAARPESRRRTAVRWVVLVGFPLLDGFEVLARYHAAWGAAETVAVGVWWYPAVLSARRAPALWLSRHPVAAFLAFSSAMTSMVFGTVALFVGGPWRLPPWVSLAVAAGVGTSLVASVWRAQLGFYAAMRSRND